MDPARSRRRASPSLVRAAVALLALLSMGCGDIVVLQLPSVDELDAVPRDPPLQTEVFDADGRRLAVLRREYREPVSLSDVPTHLVHAVLTAEDRRFYDHAGVDARSVARAALANAATGDAGQGGSTITQQLVKALYLPDAPRTPETKVQEAILARQLEKERSKASILEEYLNTIYLGENAYGVAAASWTYFRKEVSDLDVAESALLAAIIRSPDAFAPTRAPQQARWRRDDVLWRMTRDGHLDREQRNDATARPIDVHGPPASPTTREPHFVGLVVRTLLDDPSFGDTAEERSRRLYGGGLRIHTTLQPAVQAAARAALEHHLPDPDDPEAAIAAIDPRTGHLVASAGNRSHEDLQFDLATQAQRQPGSTFKTFVLAAAIADGWHPEDLLDGRQGEIRTADSSWDVSNYDRRSYPRVTLAGATRASINAAYVRLGIEVGLPRVAGLARAMGVSSTVPDDEIQITIGGGGLGVTPLDMAAGYGTIGNLGTHVPTVVVSRIEDAEGRTVWLPDRRSTQVLSPSAAFVTAGVLQDAVENGTGRAARVPGWPVAGKTGTTSDHTDAWFVGTTPVLSAAVWIGHAEGRIPLIDVQGVERVTGGSIPAAMFATFMTDALSETSPVLFELADDHYALVDIDPVTGLLAAPWCPGQTQRLPRTLAPTETCPEPPPPPPPPPPEPPEPEPVPDEADETPESDVPAEDVPAEDVDVPAEDEPAEDEPPPPDPTPSDGSETDTGSEPDGAGSEQGGPGPADAGDDAHGEDPVDPDTEGDLSGG